MKKLFLPILTAFIVASSHTGAAITLNANIVSFLAGTTGNSYALSPATQDFIFADANGNSVILRLTATTSTGEKFYNMSNMFAGVGNDATIITSNEDRKEWDNTEDIIFSVSYVSHTNADGYMIDPDSIAFRFDSIGARLYGTGKSMTYTVNGGTAQTINQIGASGISADYGLDSAFTTIGTATGGVYSGVLHNNQPDGYFVNNSATNGLNISANFTATAVPEPSSFLLGSAGLLLALFHRKRKSEHG